jgi:phosphate/sulfate permease
MNESFKGTVIGGIIGLIVVAFSIIVYYRMVNIKPDWVIVVSIPFALALTGWYITFLNKKNDEYLKKKEYEIDKKVMDEDMRWMRDKTDEHIAMDNMLYTNLLNDIKALDENIKANFKCLTELVITNINKKK